MSPVAVWIREWTSDCSDNKSISMRIVEWQCLHLLAAGVCAVAAFVKVNSFVSCSIIALITRSWNLFYLNLSRVATGCTIAPTTWTLNASRLETIEQQQHPPSSNKQFHMWIQSTPMEWTQRKCFIHTKCGGERCESLMLPLLDCCRAFLRICIQSTRHNIDAGSLKWYSTRISEELIAWISHSESNRRR